ncbi:MAG: XRE family transcriptional regulator [Candidatus Binatia bacterium]
MNISSKGERIRKIRELASLTQEEFGRRVGCSQDNVSKIETGESNPSKPLELNICREFGISEIWLRDGTGPIYKEEVRERPVDYGFDVPPGIPEDIPMLGGARGEFSEDGYPVGHGYGRVRRPYDVRDPRAFALEVKGDSMSPRYEEGDIVVCSPAKGYRSGDYCVVITEEGASLVKRVHERGNHFILSSIAPGYDPILLKKSEVRAIHKIVWKKER